MSDIIFEATALPAGKKGILKQDGAYREICVGGLNSFNRTGAYYTYSENSKVAQIFQESSDFMRRIANGQLFGEYDHPKADPKMTRQELFVRRLTVEPDRIAAHFRKIWLVPDGAIDDKGRKCIAIMAEVAPAGPFGKYVEESFNNPSMNTAFSIRCFTKDTPISGVLYKAIAEVVTFDFIEGEQGLSQACAWKTPSLESLDLSMRIYTQSDLNNIVSSIEQGKTDGYSQESNAIALAKAKSLAAQTVIKPNANSKIFNW